MKDISPAQQTFQCLKLSDKLDKSFAGNCILISAADVGSKDDKQFSISNCSEEKMPITFQKVNCLEN